MAKSYEELLVQIKDINKIVINYIGEDEIISKIYDDEGPIHHYVEMHGFTYGPGEDCYEYGEVTNKKIENCLENHYSKLLLFAESFIKSIKDNKQFFEKIYANYKDPDWDLFEKRLDPINITLKDDQYYNVDFCDYLIETYI